MSTITTTGRVNLESNTDRSGTHHCVGVQQDPGTAAQTKRRIEMQAKADERRRTGHPGITVIGNDAGWTQIARDQVVVLNDDVGTVLSHSQYHMIADALDAKGILLDTIEHADEVLKNAKAASQNGTPVLINALLGKTDFRKGSISV